MAQETFYFSHDYSPISDPKLQALVGQYGAVGYGVFWRVVEMLHADENHKLPLKKYLYMAISQQLSTPVDQVESIITDCVGVFELFASEGESFWSNRVNRNIEIREQISERNSRAGKLSAESRRKLKELSEKYPNIDVKDLTGVEQPLTDVERLSTKERKGKQMKLNEMK